MHAGRTFWDCTTLVSSFLAPYLPHPAFHPGPLSPASGSLVAACAAHCLLPTPTAPPPLLTLIGVQPHWPALSPPAALPIVHCRCSTLPSPNLDRSLATLARSLTSLYRLS